MKKLVVPLAYVLSFALFIASVLWYFNADHSPDPRPAATISVVLYGDPSHARWASMEQGIGQACTELGIERPVLALVPADDAEQQMRRIRREVDDGANGLLVAACDGDKMQDFLNQISQIAPVVTVQNMVEGLPFVGPDDAAIGQALAERLSQQKEALRGVCVLAGALGQQSTQLRLEAFMQRAQELHISVTVLRNTNSEIPMEQYLSSAVAKSRPGVVVALDNETLEMAIDTVPAAMVDAKVIGVGASDKVVDSLDSGLLSEICYFNEYAIGYVATRQLAARMGIGSNNADTQVDFLMVQRENLYDPENERLLFPITQ